ncbi:MAG: SIMPL domain-containing protein [Acidobacteria bacterium]|nr:SIMPL domain-containing protein [Acidobacteriota bacterium]
MTKLVGGFALVTAVLAAGAAQAHDVNMPARQRTLSVSGQAAVQVVPDEVELVVGVETDDKELERAKADNDRRLEAALGATRRHGVAPEKVATDYLNVEPRWDTRDDERVFLGYWVRKNLTLTLRDLSQFDALLSELLTAGVTHVHDIEFRTTELRKHRDEARRLAAVAAREKGELLARELGAALGEPISISEERGGFWYGYGSWWGQRWNTSAMQNTVTSFGSAPAEPTGTLSPGQISVQATVSVTFELVTP